MIMPDAMTDAPQIDPSDRTVHAVRTQGFALLPTLVMALERPADWDDFAAEWNTLPLDQHMGDGGRYRRRRYGAFRAAQGEIKRLPHRAHFQHRCFNPLNGGYDRWFAPLDKALAGSPVFITIVRGVLGLVERLGAPNARYWDVEVHQFRIEATVEHIGLPTPEGPHRDGRDWVFLMAVARENVADGETRLHDESGMVRWSRTLAPGEGLLIDDRRFLHSTSAIKPRNPQVSARRDVLVLTFSAVLDARERPPASSHAGVGQ